MTTRAASQQRAVPTGALRHIRVVEFGHYIPGPLLGMLLADQGADVIKVERPFYGDPARSQPAFATWNRGKRSVALELKTEEGRADAQKLAQTADVVIENFRPGVAERLGIGYPELTERNSQLIYVSLPGFGEGHPWRSKQGWESIVAAATGLYQKVDANPEPVYSPLPVASTFAAINGAVAVGQALIARQRTGQGQRIEISLYNAMFTAMGRLLVRFHDLDHKDRRNYPVLPMVRQYQCADGRWVQHNGTFERFVRQFLTVAGHPEWIDDAVAAQKKVILDQATADMWLERFAGIFRQRAAHEWQEQISAAGGACAVCNPIEEWLSHPHAIESGMVAEADDARYGRMKQPGVVVKLRGTPGAIQCRAPLLGEHTAEIRAELEAEPLRMPAVPAAPQEKITHPLDGARVLDLCIILAGPTCGRTLAEYGADVIKIDDPRRPTDLIGSLDVNRGKRSILLDLKTEAGREVFWKLLDTADVVVENYRKGKLAQLGLDYESMRRRKPDIIYASLNAYGMDGPWSGRPGWEQLAQAVSGIQVRRGGRDGRPQLMPYPINDYGTGVLGAYAVTLALLERQRTGRGQRVNGGLAFTACLHQSPFFLDYAGFQRDEIEGLNARGESALVRLYPAADGWLFLRAPSGEDWLKLVSVPEFAALGRDPRFDTTGGRLLRDAELAEALCAILAAQPRQAWLDKLERAGVNAAPAITIPEFRDAPEPRQAGVVVTREHPGRGRVDHLGSPALLAPAAIRLGRPSPVYGAETVEILREAGCSEAQIAAMLECGAAVQWDCVTVSAQGGE